MTLQDKVNIAVKRLRKFRDVCYSEDSNDLFDENYDNFLYQISGLNEMMMESAGSLEGYKSEINQVFEMTNKIEAYYTWTQSKPFIKWVYG